MLPCMPVNVPAGPGAQQPQSGTPLTPFLVPRSTGTRDMKPLHAQYLQQARARLDGSIAPDDHAVRVAWGMLCRTDAPPSPLHPSAWHLATQSTALLTWWLSEARDVQDHAAAAHRIVPMPLKSTLLSERRAWRGLGEAGKRGQAAASESEDSVLTAFDRQRMLCALCDSAAHACSALFRQAESPPMALAGMSAAVSCSVGGALAASTCEGMKCMAAAGGGLRGTLRDLLCAHRDRAGSGSDASDLLRSKLRRGNWDAKRVVLLHRWHNNKRQAA